jgi:hypothetical protein
MLGSTRVRGDKLAVHRETYVFRQAILSTSQW